VGVDMGVWVFACADVRVCACESMSVSVSGCVGVNMRMWVSGCEGVWVYIE
jgi:hypothetical protein